MSLIVPKSAKLIAADLRGQHIEMPADTGSMRIICLTPDCRDLHLTLVLGNPGATDLTISEARYGLPEFGDRLKTARPDVAMPSQSGDEVVLSNTLTLKAH